MGVKGKKQLSEAEQLEAAEERLRNTSEGPSVAIVNAARDIANAVELMGFSGVLAELRTQALFRGKQYIADQMRDAIETIRRREQYGVL